MVNNIEYTFDISSIIVCLITTLGVILTAVISFHQYKQTKWNENVSKERALWLKEFRKEFGLIMKAYALIQSDEKETEDSKKECIENCNIILDAEEARYVLISRINTNKLEGNEFNFRYKELLKEIKFAKEGFKEEQMKELLNLTNLILESEWQKIKKEAKGVTEYEE